MKQQPDKLFQDKLSHYSKPVPAPVWQRLEIQLDEKKNRIMWLKIAASILLTVVAASLLWPLTQSPKRHNITENHIPVPLPKSGPPYNPPAYEAPAPSVLRQNTAVTSPVTTSDSILKENKTVRKKKKTIESAKPSTALLIAEVRQPEVHITKEPTTQQAVADPQAVDAIAKKPEQSVTLIFSAADTQGYLNKKIKYDATSADKKPSTLKKLLTKATAFKNNQDPFGELREMKNDILALNRSDRRRGQNK